MNKDAKLNYEEFKEGSKQDPTIVQVSSVTQSMPKGERLFRYSGSLTVRWFGIRPRSKLLPQAGQAECSDWPDCILYAYTRCDRDAKHCMENSSKQHQSILRSRCNALPSRGSDGVCTYPFYTAAQLQFSMNRRQIVRSQRGGRQPERRCHRDS